MSKFFKITTVFAVLVACSSSFAGDLSKEKGIMCAGFYDNAAAFENMHNDKNFGMKKFKYMMDNVEKYGKKMGVSEESLNSATTRAKDVDLAAFKLHVEELKSKHPNADGAEVGNLFLKYFKAREKKLNC